uniref:RNase H type-1 domain-containing protein n=1 Tax=Fagus sylvatica TaxID=28930 RepID=A0A2N9G0G5_FAGSY
MFWFGLCWGFRPDLIPMSSNLVIVKAFEGKTSSVHRKDYNWCPPLTGVIKINVDVAIHATTTSIVVIARDGSENFVKAWTNIIPMVEPTDAEASAIL